MKLLKYLIVFVGVFVLFGLFTKSVFASTPKASPAPEVNSFELFWPLSPGKVKGDSLYPLKELKEKFRGMFIFGAPEKVDYELLLATKRAIEAEKLLKDGKTDLAIQTLDVFLAKLDISISKWDEAKMSGNTPVTTKDNVRKQLNNLEVFLKYLSSKNTGEVKSKVDQGLEKVKKLQNSL